MSSGQSKIIGWKVVNLHGYYNKAYWKDMTTDERDIGNLNPTPGESNGGALGIPQGGFGNLNPTLQAEIPAKQSVEKIQPPFNQRLINSELPTKVVQEELVDIAAATQPPPPKGAAAAAGGKDKEEAIQSDRVCPINNQEDDGEKDSGLDGGNSSAAANCPEEVLGYCDTSERQEEALLEGENISGDDIHSAAGNCLQEVIEKAIALGYDPIPEHRAALAMLSDRQLSILIREFVAAIRRGSRRKKRDLFDHAIRLGKYRTSS
jgi:hypothetical protein